jgi:uncharacterized protein YbbC (DUF1343 family)
MEPGYSIMSTFNAVLYNPSFYRSLCLLVKLQANIQDKMEMIMESKCFLYIYIHTHSPESYNHSIERLEQHYYTCDGDPRKEFFGFFFKISTIF